MRNPVTQVPQNEKKKLHMSLKVVSSTNSMKQGTLASAFFTLVLSQLSFLSSSSSEHLHGFNPASSLSHYCRRKMMYFNLLLLSLYSK